MKESFLWKFKIIFSGAPILPCDNLMLISHLLKEYVCQNVHFEQTTADVFLSTVKGSSIEGNVGAASIKTAPSMTNLSRVVTAVLPAALSANTVSLFVSSCAWARVVPAGSPARYGGRRRARLRRRGRACGRNRLNTDGGKSTQTLQL